MTPPQKKCKRDGISAPKTQVPFMPVKQMAEKRPHLYRLLRFMLAQKKRVCTKEVVIGMMQRQVHYPRWKKYLYALRDMGYLEKKSTYSANRKKVLLVEWWVVPEWADKLAFLKQSPLWERLRPEIKLNGTTGCWEWVGYVQEGRGVVGWDNRAYYVNYLVFRLFKELPKGMELQACQNPACCNPKHQTIIEGKKV